MQYREISWPRGYDNKSSTKMLLVTLMAELSCFLLQLIYCAGFGKRRGKWNQLSFGLRSDICVLSLPPLCVLCGLPFSSTMGGSSISHIYGRSNDKERNMCRVRICSFSDWALSLCASVVITQFSFLLFQVVEYEGSNHIRNPEMQRVLLTHEIICR